jgi:hypothetical protein
MASFSLAGLLDFAGVAIGLWAGEGSQLSSTINTGGVFGGGNSANVYEAAGR